MIVYLIKKGKDMVIHTVEKGDTVYKLSRKYGISASKIISDNGLSSPNDLVIGQSLVVLPAAKTYVVRRDDTLFSIARRFNTSVMHLLRNNPELKGKTAIFPGQILTISYPASEYGSITVNGYAFPNIAEETLKSTLPYLTYLSIFSHNIKANGEITKLDDANLISIAKQYNTLPVMVLASIGESGGFNEALVDEFLRNNEAQEKAIKEIHKIIKEKGYSGVDVDFEYIGAKNANNYTNFIKKLRQEICSDGFFVFVDLPPKISESQRGVLYEGQIYSDIGKVANAVMLMTYEWGYTFGPPLPVAPINKVREVAEFAVNEIPSEMVTLGIPNYGYVWKLPYVEDNSRARNISNSQAIAIARDKKAEIQFDTTAQTPFFTFYEKKGNDITENIAYFEDARSIKAKLDLAHELGLKGVGYWNIMNLFTPNWSLLNYTFNIVKGYDTASLCPKDE